MNNSARRNCLAAILRAQSSYSYPCNMQAGVGGRSSSPGPGKGPTDRARTAKQKRKRSKAVEDSSPLGHSRFARPAKDHPWRRSYKDGRDTR